MNPLNIQDLLGLILSFMPPPRQLVHKRVCKSWLKEVERNRESEIVHKEWWKLYNSADSLFAYKGLEKAAKLNIGC